MGDSGTAAAFDEFVAARGPALWRTAWLLTGDRHKAEDLVQTALAKAWRRFGTVDNFEGYLRRTMVNTYRSWWRRRWTGEVPVGDELVGTDREPAAHDAPPDPDLMAALAELPRSQRAVLVLRYFEGMTEREISELLEIRPGTVKSHAARGLAALRRSPRLNSEEV